MKINMSKSVLEYLKSQNSAKEYYQIPLSDTELKYIFNEDPKLMQKLQDAKILVPFDSDSESEEESSPYCLKLLKKGYLTNIEKKELITSDPKAQISQIQGMLGLFTAKLTTRDVQQLYPILQEVTNAEDELDEGEGEAIEKALAKSDVSREKQEMIAETFRKEGNEDLLLSFFNINASDKIGKLIDKVEKFFVLRMKGMKLIKNEIANLPETVLEKISTFIEYEGLNWEGESIPKSLEQNIIIEES